jgi:signal transduction histidine kinase
MMIMSFIQAVRRNWQILTFVAVVLTFVLSLGAGFYWRGKTLMEVHLKNKLRDTAAVAAMQFNAEEVSRIHGRESMTDPVFADIVWRLRALRERTESIQYAYLLRKTTDPHTVEFVADADSLATPAELDANHNGVFEAYEEASYPGDAYDVSDIPALWGPAFLQPSVDDEITVDQWGQLISGYAPIVDSSGKTVAVLGIDMDAADFHQLTQSIFSPIVFLLLFITSLLFAGYVFMYLWTRRLENLQHIDTERSGVMLLTSHQLGTPLTIFQWAVEGLKDSAKQKTLEQDLPHHLENMQVGIQRLHDVLDELQRASKAEKGLLEYKREHVVFSDLIQEVVHQMIDESARFGINVHTNLDTSIQLTLDRTLIAEVLRELIHNAFIYSHSGGNVSIILKKVRDAAVVEVRDEGIGIPLKDTQRIFGKFVRASNAYTSSPNGNGLGLFTAKAIVHKAGGKMWIKSKEQSGTSVFFALPLTSSAQTI